MNRIEEAKYDYTTCKLIAGPILLFWLFGVVLGFLALPFSWGMLIVLLIILMAMISIYNLFYIHQLYPEEITSRKLMLPMLLVVLNTLLWITIMLIISFQWNYPIHPFAGAALTLIIGLVAFLVGFDFPLQTHRQELREILKD